MKLTTDIFGVKLKPASTKLLSEVEKLAKVEIREFTCSDKGGETVGYSGVDKYGPFIVLSDKRGISEDTIVHELFHLRLILKGFPKLQTCETEKVVDPLATEYANLFCKDINNGLHHWAFYPEMRSMGLTPQDGYSRWGQIDLRSDFPGITNRLLLREERVLFFFECSLEIPEQSILDHLAQWYESKGWIDELKTVREMIGLVKSAKISKPKNALKVMRELAMKIGNERFNLKVADPNTEVMSTAQITTINACVQAAPRITVRP